MEIADVQNGRNAWFSRRKRYAWQATRRFRRLGPIDRVHLDEYPYPHYAYGVLVAAMQARMLGHDTTTVIEFGVAGGNGLVALEAASREIGAELGVRVDVLGFDNVEGMPESTDVRDMTYWFRPAAFKMDEPALRARLSAETRLFPGLIKDTVPQATAALRGPIGFVSIDMDYYSATVDILRIFEAAPETRMPRVVVYADDIFGYHDLNIMGTSVGEERAFAEFNANHSDQRIEPIRGLRYKRPIPAMWNEKMFALHDLAHPDYSKPINPTVGAAASQLLSLR